MAFDLQRFSLVDMLQCGRGLRSAAEGAERMEDAATAIATYLHSECMSDSDGGLPCALVRFYMTVPYRSLEPGLQRFADDLLGETQATGNMKCLTLLATRGVEPEWSDRRLSRGHQAIPLPSVRIVEQAPMIAQLLSQMGLDISSLLTPDTSIVHHLAGKTYNVFHVVEAMGSPFIPAQAEFVERYGIRSVVGFGGLLHTGEMFAIVMFSRGLIPHEAAVRFRNIALDVKAVLHPLSERPIFAASAVAG